MVGKVNKLYLKFNKYGGLFQMNQRLYRLFAFILCFFLSCSQSIGGPIGVTPKKIDIDPNQMIALLGQKRSSPQFNSLLLKLAGNNPALLKNNRFPTAYSLTLLPQEIPYCPFSVQARLGLLFYPSCDP